MSERQLPKVSERTFQLAEAELALSRFLNVWSVSHRLSNQELVSILASKVARFAKV